AEFHRDPFEEYDEDDIQHLCGRKNIGSSNLLSQSLPRSFTDSGTPFNFSSDWSSGSSGTGRAITGGRDSDINKWTRLGLNGNQRDRSESIQSKFSTEDDRSDENESPNNLLTDRLNNLSFGTSVLSPIIQSPARSPLTSTPIGNFAYNRGTRFTGMIGASSMISMNGSGEVFNPAWADQRWTLPIHAYDTLLSDVEKAAQAHRSAASYSEARCTWSGQINQKQHKNPSYSCKVFLGGVPWDITESGLMEAFSSFGPIRVQWPGRDVRSTPNPNPHSQKAGYVYVIFDTDRQVKSLLQSCTHDFSQGGKWYFNISSKKMRAKEVQVIPWVISDSNFVSSPAERLDPQKTVFVGALHGMLTAQGLAQIMNDLFGGVVYCGIDTDKYKYPIGSGRLTFNNAKSYSKAVQAGFIDIKCTRFTKKIQVDPYLEPSNCSKCGKTSGPIFCRDSRCFSYFCKPCWNWFHADGPMKQHRPMMRNKRD
ncbi:Cytoplasmic polyadenylation element-binding protein 1-B-like protein, partial [Leptotrombidium deliense]